MELKYTE